MRPYDENAPTWDDIGTEFEWGGDTYKIASERLTDGKFLAARPGQTSIQGVLLKAEHVLIEAGFMAPKVLSRRFLAIQELLTDHDPANPPYKLGQVANIHSLPGMEAVMGKAAVPLFAGSTIRDYTGDHDYRAKRVMEQPTSKRDSFVLTDVPEGHLFWALRQRKDT